MSVLYDVVPEERGRTAQSSPTLQVIAGLWPRLSNAQYWVVIAAIAVAGMGMITFVQLQLSQGAFVEATLQSELRATNTEVHNLQTKLIQLTSGKSMREKAKNLGMVESGNPVGLALVDGQVLGLPKPAPRSQNRAEPGANVDTSSGAWSTNDAAVQITGG